MYVPFVQTDRRDFELIEFEKMQNVQWLPSFNLKSFLYKIM